MYKNVLSAIPGIENYPIAALVLFFGFFIGLLVWYVRVDKKQLELIARQPLEEDTQAPSHHSSTHPRS